MKRILTRFSFALALGLLSHQNTQAQGLNSCPHCPDRPPKVNLLSFLHPSAEPFPDTLLAYADAPSVNMRAGIGPDFILFFDQSREESWEASTVNVEEADKLVSISLKFAGNSGDNIAFLIHRVVHPDKDSSVTLTEDKLLIWNKKDTYLYVDFWINQDKTAWEIVGKATKPSLVTHSLKKAEFKLLPNGVIFRRPSGGSHCFCKYKFYLGKTIREVHEHGKKDWI